MYKKKFKFFLYQYTYSLYFNILLIIVNYNLLVLCFVDTENVDKYFAVQKYVDVRIVYIVIVSNLTFLTSTLLSFMSMPTFTNSHPTNIYGQSYKHVHIFFFCTFSISVQIFYIHIVWCMSTYFYINIQILKNISKVDVVI